jgi:hypothetical protein
MIGEHLIKYDLRNPLLRPLGGIDVYHYEWFDTIRKRLPALHIRFLPESKITTRFGAIMFDERGRGEKRRLLEIAERCPVHRTPKTEIYIRTSLA